MEKKSLGRGLEDISSVFLSQTADVKKRRDSSSVTPREALCLSCLNYVEGPFKPPQCKVFAGSNGEKHVSRPDPVAMNHADPCRHFEAILPQERSAAAGRANEDLSMDHIQCEIEETISVQRRISYPVREDTQQKMRKALNEHLDAGFSLKSVELSRVEAGEEPQRSSRREEVVLCVKG